MTACGTEPARQCYAPTPAGTYGSNVWIDAGTVDADEAAGRLFGEPFESRQRRSVDSAIWSGGTYPDTSGLDDIQGFRITMLPPAGGAAIDWSAPTDSIAAYPGGWLCDGFGLGGFGLGGFGRSASTYSWTSGGKSSGTWQFAVVPFDHEGNNRGAGQTVSVSVVAAPLPPARSPSWQSVNYSYSGSITRQLTLTWLPSPSLDS